MSMEMTLDSGGRQHGISIHAHMAILALYLGSLGFIFMVNARPPQKSLSLVDYVSRCSVVRIVDRGPHYMADHLATRHLHDCVYQIELLCRVRRCSAARRHGRVNSNLVLVQTMHGEMQQTLKRRFDTRAVLLGVGSQAMFGRLLEALLASTAPRSAHAVTTSLSNRRIGGGGARP